MPHNSKTIKLLQYCYDSTNPGDSFRRKAYANAIESVKMLPYELTPARVIVLKPSEIPGLGKSILDKIYNYLKSGKLPTFATVDDYTLKLMNVGPALAAELREKYPTFEALRKNYGKLKLTHAQQLGIKYYTDLTTPIPRAEVARIAEALRKSLDAKTFIVAGSYRRGLPRSNDIDIITDMPIADIFDIVSKHKQYIATISKGAEKLSFLYKLGKYIRRVDIMYAADIVPALLYFTGSANHNRKVRALAKSRGYILNQLGLFRVSTGAKVPLKKEEDLYKILEIPYVEPSGR